jgi:hypothetical protein
MAGQGQALFDAGKRYDVDPRFLVALAGAETSFGRNITRGQFNAWNWLYRGPSHRDHPFRNWEEGVNRVAMGIAQGPNYFRAGRTDTTSVYQKYCDFANDPNCARGLRNLNDFLKQQGGDPGSLRFPCK